MLAKYLASIISRVEAWNKGIDMMGVSDVIDSFQDYAEGCLLKAQKLESNGDVLMGSVYRTVGEELMTLVIQTSFLSQEEVSAYE